MSADKPLLRLLKRTLFVLVAAALLAAVLYGLYRWTERYEATLLAQAQLLQQQQQQLQQQEQASSRQLKIVQQALENQQAQLDEQQLALRRLDHISSASWQWREAHALSRMAERRLQLMGDYHGALQLLKEVARQLTVIALPEGNTEAALVREDIELLEDWYQASLGNLRASLVSVHDLYPGVFISAEQLAVQADSGQAVDGWEQWLSQLPLRFTPRQQAAVRSVSASEWQQRAMIFRLLLAQAEMAGLVQKHDDQVRLLDELQGLLDDVSLADQATLLLLKQALVDARLQAASLARPLSLKSPAALAERARGE